MKLESRYKPPVQHEIEAFPPVDGHECTIIFYENIAGPFTKENQEDEYYTYDRYTLNVPYRAGLEESVSSDRDGYLQMAIAAEHEEAPETLQEQVERLKAENADLTSQITDLQMALCDVYELNS